MTDQRPLLRVVRGRPTDEELAALVAVVAARASSTAAEPAGPARTWAAYWRTVGAPPRPGAGAWRASALPR
ncbi:MAG TPA: acyl-CoA carboxylase subunit epsilon [Jiangellales bacterium]|nr:acyl-CoA carboxylase subunit epsilon [Jiangellales bacterium]